MGQPAAQAVGAVVTDFCDKIRHRRTNMSASPADEQQEPTRAKSFRLPPMFGPIENGQRTWKRLGEIDYELMGYLLSCHLVLEHYMDEFLKAHHEHLDWDAAKLTFGQRVALLNNWNLNARFNPVSTIKHLNNLRNRFSHRIDYVLSREDMLPIVHYLERATEHPMKDASPKELLELFTSICCAAFAGSVSGIHEFKKPHGRNSAPQNCRTNRQRIRLAQQIPAQQLVLIQPRLLPRLDRRLCSGEYRLRNTKHCTRRIRSSRLK